MFPNSWSHLRSRDRVKVQQKVKKVSARYSLNSHQRRTATPHQTRYRAGSLPTGSCSPASTTLRCTTPGGSSNVNGRFRHLDVWRQICYYVKFRLNVVLFQLKSFFKIERSQQNKFSYWNILNKVFHLKSCFQGSFNTRLFTVFVNIQIINNKLFSIAFCIIRRFFLFLVKFNFFYRF